MDPDPTDSAYSLVGDVTSPEHAIVGTALHDPEILDAIDLSDQDFRNLRLGALYRLLATMRAEGEHIDPVHVTARIHRDGLHQVTAVDIHDLYADAPLGSFMATSHARIIREQAVRRRLLEAAMRIAQMARSGADVAEIVENARADVDASSRAVVDEWSMADAFDKFLAQVGTEQVMFPTMWPELNGVLGGYRPGELYVLGARPGVGKSIFGIQAMIDLAEYGQVVMHSLEMPTSQVLTRLAANIARVDTRRLDGSGGEMRDIDTMMIEQHASEVRNMPLSIDDRGSVTVNQIRSHVRTVARRGKVAGLIVDYLGLIAASRPNMNTYERVSESVRLLKALAKEFDIPVILQAQLNRQVEQRASAIPGLGDLRDSGEIEQHAGVVMFLYESEVEGYGLFVAKNRHGPHAVNIRLVRRGEFSRLENATFGQPHREEP
jgi:replicative DNA helicase